MLFDANERSLSSKSIVNRIAKLQNQCWTRVSLLCFISRKRQKRSKNQLRVQSTREHNQFTAHIVNVSVEIVTVARKFYWIIFDWLVQHLICMTPFVSDEKGNFTHWICFLSQFFLSRYGLHRTYKYVEENQIGSSRITIARDLIFFIIFISNGICYGFFPNSFLFCLISFVPEIIMICVRAV